VRYPAAERLTALVWNIFDGTSICAELVHFLYEQSRAGGLQVRMSNISHVSVSASDNMHFYHDVSDILSVYKICLLMKSFSVNLF
jgi:hypothetical protein